jgi:cytidine deaminase
MSSPLRVAERGFRGTMHMSGDSIRELIDAAREVQGAFALREPSLEAGCVGAAVRSTGGRIYTGICLDLACGIGFCAEHSAIAEMLKHRETRIAAIVAVNADGILPPCGRCRELIAQLDEANFDTAVILGPDRSVPLKELLPHFWL